MIFYIRKSFICSFCGEKHYNGLRLKNGFGICDECDKAMPRTPVAGTFAGSPNVGYVISALFYEGKVRDAIVRCKFKGWSGNCDVFAYIMREYVKNFPHLSKFDMVIPVPLSKERLYERGFNQSQRLAKAIADIAGIEYNEIALVKIRNNKRQSRLSEAERILNVKGVYAASQDVNGKRIILVDDIYTSGATLEECAAAMKEAGAIEVIGVTLSVRYKKEKNMFLRY